MTLVEAVKTGSHRAILIALLYKLAEMIDSKDSARDIASNSKRLMEVLAELDALPPEEAASPLDRAREGR